MNDVAKIIRGANRQPFAEVGPSEDRKTHTLTNALKYAALGTVGIYGVRWASKNVTVSVDPHKFQYLTEGLNRAGQTPWWGVRGYALQNGKIEARLGDFLLEGIKRFEEMGGGVPRTFGLFGFASRQAFTDANSYLRINPADIIGAEDHYAALVGRKLEPLERIHGFHVSPTTNEHLAEYVMNRSLAAGTPMSMDQARLRVTDLINTGELEPGRFPGLFSSTPDGKIGKLLVPDVQIGVRRWNIEDPNIGINPDTGLPKSQQIIRDTDAISEAMGARPISHKNPSTYQVFKAPERVSLGSTTKGVVGAFTDPSTVEDFLTKASSPRTRRAALEGHTFAKKMSERYLRMMDTPLEAIEELIGKTRAVDAAKNTKAYGFFRNIFGTGGDYTGSVGDLWGRHIRRMIPLALGIAATYEVGSAITNLLSGRNLGQLGGEAIGAAQRLYARASDVTGLTSLNSYQEEEAKGSHRLLGVMAFPMAGYLTGRVAASLTNPIVSDQLAWKTAREEIHELPEQLGFMKKFVKSPMTRGAKFGLAGAVIGAALSAPFFLGSLGSSQSYDEVVAEQAGETEVAVKKGANWEMGRTDIEGEETKYYRPGWFRRLMDKPADELQLGSMADRPFSRFIKGLYDPYWKEKELYEDRPYPISGPDTTGFGPLGTLWGMTIGRVLKNPVTMHTDELGGDAGAIERGDIVRYGSDASNAPSRALGGTGPIRASSPYSQSFLAGEMAYKATEAAGLPGFIFSTFKKKLTGTPDFGVDSPVLASFANVGSMQDRFWDLNLGGGYMTTEAFRRFVPNERYELQKLNPIANKMPSWMPGPNNYTDFKHGDPYAAIPEGEYRLPGSGYAARYEELKGVNPEDYPDIHKYRILGDVAPFSKEFKSISEKMDNLAKGNQLSEQDRWMYEATKQELIEREKRVEFRDKPDSLLGNYWSFITELGRKNPVEHLLPISPVHKFAGPVSAIAEYEDRNVYSTRTPSWEGPIEDFIKPAFNNTMNLLGYEGIPGSVQEERALKGYFDKLEYLKYKRLEANARSQGEGRAAYAYARKAQYTMYGADPYGDMENIKKVLPREERNFFDEFVATEDPNARARILELVPDYTRKFYTAQWQKQIYAGLAAKGDLSSSEEDLVTAIESQRATEGQMADVNSWQAYQKAVSSGRTNPDTFPNYLRAKRLEPYFDDQSPFGMPAADWIGYDPDVNIDDVKLKVVQTLGKDFHDFDLWDNDVMNVSRKPYVDVAANKLMKSAGVREDVIKSLTSSKINDLNVEVVDTIGDKTRISLDLRADRRQDIDAQLRKFGIRYGDA